MATTLEQVLEGVRAYGDARHDEGYQQAVADLKPPSPPKPTWPRATYEPIHAGYGDAVRAFDAEHEDVQVLPVVRDQYGADEGDWVLDQRNRDRLAQILDAGVPHFAPRLFWDMEKSDHPFKQGPDDVRRRIIDYRISVLDFAESHRPDLASTVHLCWKAPAQEHNLARFDDEYYRIGRLWGPLIARARGVVGRFFPWHGNALQDLSWMLPYAAFCLELAEGKPVVATTADVTKPEAENLTEADRAYLYELWSGIASVRSSIPASGNRIASFDLFATYKGQGGLLTDPAQIVVRDDQHVWALNAMRRLLGA